MQVIDRAIPINEFRQFLDILRDTDGVLISSIVMHVNDAFVTVSYEPGDMLEMEKRLNKLLTCQDKRTFKEDVYNFFMGKWG